MEPIERQVRHSRWTIDKHIPVAVIIAMLGQTALLVWYIATFTTNTENRLKNLEEFKAAQSDNYKHIPEKIAKLEAQQSFTNLMLSEILGELKNDHKRN
ncbi:MAG TPA: hypothetical protein VD999_07870 [Vitreimonas sp.]|nr:hypothetical protein [Vitreimonas sp.]